jgi:hypothetical protein
MLQPSFDVRSISAERRNKSNPWFKRGTLFRSAVNVLRRATAPNDGAGIADALIARKAPQVTRKQAIDLQQAIVVALRRNGTPVIGAGTPARWRLQRVRPSILDQSANPAKLYLNLRYTLGARRVCTKVPLAR